MGFKGGRGSERKLVGLFWGGTEKGRKEGVNFFLCFIARSLDQSTDRSIFS